MNMRPFRLPGDLDVLPNLAGRAFQYPENPEWNVDPDEQQGFEDTMRTTRRMYPLIRLLQPFSPLMRDLLCGVVCEEDGKPAGICWYVHLGSMPSWNINVIAVLPEYRGRGFARQMLETSIDDLRRRGARLVTLSVIDGNLPAYTLYESFGFVHLGGSNDFDYVSSQAPERHSLPPGYQAARITATQGREQTEACRRIFPAEVQAFEPVDPARYEHALPSRLVFGLIERALGTRWLMSGVRDGSGRLVGWFDLHARIRAGGISQAMVLVDPEQAFVAPYVAVECIRTALKVSPGRRLQIMCFTWNRPVIEALAAVGAHKRLEYHHMGLKLAAS
jgi:GNAT superfamily N-acetyltransferase